MSIYDDYLKKKDEEEKRSVYQEYLDSRKPSQKAAEEVTPTKKPSFISNTWEKVKQSAKNIFTKETAKKIMPAIEDFTVGKEQYLSPVPEKPDVIKQDENAYVKSKALVYQALKDAEEKKLVYESEVSGLQRTQPGYYKAIKSVLNYNPLALPATLIKGYGGYEEPEVIKRKKALRDLNDNIEIYKEYLELEQADRGFFQGLWKSAKKPETLVPFASEVKLTGDVINVYRATKKLKNGEVPEVDELADLEAWRTKAVNETIDRGFGYNVGETVAHLPAFAMEFALTGGVYNLAKGVVIKGVEKTVLPKVVGKIAGWAVGSLAQTAVNIPSISANTAEYLIPNAELIVGENGDTVISSADKGGDNFDKAISKGFLKSYIGIATERMGVIIEEAPTFMKKAILGKFAEKMAITSPSVLAQVAEKIGWNGIIGEVFEEEMNEIAEAKLENRKYYIPLLTPEGTERLLTESLSIGIFGGLGKVTDVTINTAKDLQTKAPLPPIDIPVKEVKATEEEKPASVMQEELEKKQKKTGENTLENAITQYQSDQGVTISPTKEVNVSPALKELTELSKTKEVITATQEKVKTLPKNNDGTVTVYRVGTVREGDNRLVSASYTKEAAVAFNELHKKDMGDRSITEIKVRPEDIKVFIGGTENEVLVQNPATSVAVEEPRAPTKLDTTELKLDSTTESKVQELNIKDVQNPISEELEKQGYKRFYQVTTKTGTTDWYFDNPVALAIWSNNRSEGTVFKYQDILESEMTKDGVREDVWRVKGAVEGKPITLTSAPVTVEKQTELPKEVSAPSEIKKVTEKKITEAKAKLPTGTGKGLEGLPIGREVELEKHGGGLFAEKKLSPAVKEDVSLVKEAVYSGDLEAAQQLHSDLELPVSFEDIKAEVIAEQNLEIQRVKNEIGDIEIDTLPVDSPDRVIVEIANKLAAHFKAPGAVWKITGKERTYVTPEGTRLTVGGDSKSAFDKLIYSTDIMGFARNMKVLAYKFDKTFSEISARIEGGDIDSGNYEKFKERFQNLIEKRPTYTKRPSQVAETGVRGREEKPVSPATTENIPSEPSAVGKRVTGTKIKASADRFADLPKLTSEAKTKTIPFPEMVRLAKDLTNSYPEIKYPRFRRLFGARPYGLFVPTDGGKIILNPDIFKDINQASNTLAHEIGHLVDYLPDKVTARGNILGRIGTLRKFLRSKFTSHSVEVRIDSLIEQRTKLQDERRNLEKDESGRTISSLKNKDSSLRNEIISLNKEVRKLQEKAIKKPEVLDELIKLSTTWKPLGEDASDEYLSYRYSPEELYADALSVLINDPALLRKEAPIFYESFFKELDQKPEVKSAYFDMVDFLNEPDEVIQTKRLDEIYEGFKEGKEKRLEIEKKEAPKRGVWERLMFQHVTRFDPIYRKMITVSKGYGMELSPATKTRMLMEEMQMRRNEQYLFLRKVNDNIVTALDKMGMTEEDLGVLLNLERNLGDRKDIANPYGLQGKYSEETLNYFGKYLKEKRGIDTDQFNILTQVSKQFRDYIFSKMTEAKNVGMISNEFYESTVVPSKDTYATYQVVEHIHDNYVSTAVIHATGTLKKIENPFVSSLLKTVALTNQIEIQKGKTGMVSQLKSFFPDDIVKSTPKRAKTGTILGWKQVENKTPFELFEEGKRVAYDVDPYLAEQFDLYSPTELHSLVQVSAKFNKVFKPIVTTYNLSWGFYSNTIRDVKRTYKLLGSILPTVGEGRGLSIFDYVTKWIKAIPTSVSLQKGNMPAIVEEMISNKAYSVSFSDFDTQANEDSSIALVMRKFKFLQPKDDVKDISFKRKLIKPIANILKGIEFVGSTLEANTKIAGYQVTSERVKDKQLASFIVRNYVGTPNFIDGGTQKYVDNNVFVFSNVMIQGVRSDLDIATNPTTASGYWYRTFLVDLLPKLMMLAAASGLLGEALKEIMDKATEYDKTNFIVVPLGVRENGKANYARIPQDESGRFTSALLWKLGSFLNGDLRKPEQIFALGAGYIPSVTPMWEVAGAWLNWARGRNPYDDYRGRLVVDDLTWRAGGLPVFEKMIQYTANQLGLSQFSTYSDETDTTFDVIVKNTPVINRAFRSTDYGLTEKEQQRKSELDKESARKSLKERDLLDKAIKEVKENPESKSSIKSQLIKEAIGDAPYDTKQKTRKTNLEKKFEIGVVKGTLGREMDSLIEAQTNDFKVELLKAYKQSMTMTKYGDLVRDALKYKVISPVVVTDSKKTSLNKQGSLMAYSGDALPNTIMTTGTDYQKEAYKRLQKWTVGEGTFYDPMDPNQTKENPDGLGTSGRKIKNGSVGFGNQVFLDRILNGEVIYIKVKGFGDVKTPYGNGIFRIDDGMSEDANIKGKFIIDFYQPDLNKKRQDIGRIPLKFKIVEPFKEKVKGSPYDYYA